MARSIKKGPYVAPHLVKKTERSQGQGDKKVIKTWSRRSTVVPGVGGTDGGCSQRQQIFPVFISENMVGHKLGEFASTRTL